jgi:hypothetical protein
MVHDGSQTAGEVLTIKSLGTAAGMLEKPIKSVELLGGPSVIHHQDADALGITCPESMPFKHAVGFKLAF